MDGTNCPENGIDHGPSKEDTDHLEERLQKHKYYIALEQFWKKLQGGDASFQIKSPGAES